MGCKWHGKYLILTSSIEHWFLHMHLCVHESINQNDLKCKITRNIWEGFSAIRITMVKSKIFQSDFPKFSHKLSIDSINYDSTDISYIYSPTVPQTASYVTVIIVVTVTYPKHGPWAFCCYTVACVRTSVSLNLLSCVPVCLCVCACWCTCLTCIIIGVW